MLLKHEHVHIICDVLCVDVYNVKPQGHLSVSPKYRGIETQMFEKLKPIISIAFRKLHTHTHTHVTSLADVYYV